MLSPSGSELGVIHLFELCSMQQKGKRNQSAASHLPTWAATTGSKIQEGHQVGICLLAGYLQATIRPSEQGEQRQVRIQQYLHNWYRSRALERLQQKAHRYAQQIGVSPAGISVRNFKSRWGSCDNRGSWFLTGTSSRHPMPSPIIWWFMSCAI